MDRPGVQRPMVLVVDDEPLLHVIASRVLERAGFEVLNAGNGFDAIGLLSRATSAPALVVTDIRMPGMSGLELGQWLASRYPTTPVLYVSGFLDEVPPTATSGSARAFLGKPFTPDLFLEQVRQLCARDGGCGGAGSSEAPTPQWSASA